MDDTDACQTEVTKCANACPRVEQKVGGFHVAMDDLSRMYITKGTKHTPKVLFDTIHGKDAVVLLYDMMRRKAQARREWTHSKIFMLVKWHDCNDLVLFSKSSHEL